MITLRSVNSLATLQQRVARHSEFCGKYFFSALSIFVPLTILLVYIVLIRWLINEEQPIPQPGPLNSFLISCVTLPVSILLTLSIGLFGTEVISDTPTHQLVYARFGALLLLFWLGHILTHMNDGILFSLGQPATVWSSYLHVLIELGLIGYLFWPPKSERDRRTSFRAE